MVSGSKDGDKKTPIIPVMIGFLVLVGIISQVTVRALGERMEASIVAGYDQLEAIGISTPVRIFFSLKPERSPDSKLPGARNPPTLKLLFLSSSISSVRKLVFPPWIFPVIRNMLCCCCAPLIEILVLNFFNHSLSCSFSNHLQGQLHVLVLYIGLPDKHPDSK